MKSLLALCVTLAIVAGGAVESRGNTGSFHADGNVRKLTGTSAHPQVRALVDGTRTAGFHEVLWDGRDNCGRNLPSGVYFYRLEAGNSLEARKMVLAR